MMTDKGTFLIHGTERVVVSQLVRSPGVYFDESIDTSTERPLHGVKLLRSRGAWLVCEVAQRDTVGVGIDRRRRQTVTVLLRAHDSAHALMENSFFRPKRYDLAKVGRYKVNRTLGLGGDTDGTMTLTEEDILTTIEYLVRLHAGERTMTPPEGVEIPIEVDDID